MKSVKKLIIESLGLIVLTLTVVGIFDAAGLIPSQEARAALDWENVEEKPASKVKVEQGKLPFSFSMHMPGAYEGFTLYPTTGTAEIFLINMKGESVHSWPIDADRVWLTPECNLLVVHGTKWGMNVEPWSALRSRVREYDFEGNVLWEYSLPGPAHHDIKRMENGNTLILQRTIASKEAKATVEDQKKRKVIFRSDRILEVTPEKEIVWEWNAHDHLDLNSCGAKDCPKMNPKLLSGEKEFDWTHTNSVSVIPENKWYAEGDERFKPGNIMILPRNFWQVMIIDKETKEVVWKYNGDYKGGLVGGHEAYMIPPHLPGAGNIMIFDNGRDKETSFVLEINPVTKKPAWVYDQGSKFFSRIAGSAQRLPNGNTLVSEDAEGRVFEVTKDQEKVWEITGSMRANRAQRYPQNFCSKLEEFDLGV